jgi:hypothetical protein
MCTIRYQYVGGVVCVLNMLARQRIILGLDPVLYAVINACIRGSQFQGTYYAVPGANAGYQAQSQDCTKITYLVSRSTPSFQGETNAQIMHIL